MKDLYLPVDYREKLGLRETQTAIKMTKDTFQKALSTALCLDRITAPLIVTKESGINDDLNGVERKVQFDLQAMPGECEVVQSLAKWKRMALYRYGYEAGHGIYTDMNAIRRDDKMDNLHSVYVDQWDWEKVITRSERTIAYLKETVKKIARTVYETKELLKRSFPTLTETLSPEVYFITTEELLQKYPTLSPKERENAIVKEHKTVFLMQIGAPLSDGMPHDGRAPDYDDWQLNGDLLYWSETLSCAFELSSMGIRVDETAMKTQLAAAKAQERSAFPYHRMILEGRLPLTIGGGIGQSRLCMLILEKAHIGEVQCSIWPEEMVRLCREHNITIL